MKNMDELPKQADDIINSDKNDLKIEKNTNWKKTDTNKNTSNTKTSNISKLNRKNSNDKTKYGNDVEDGNGDDEYNDDDKGGGVDKNANNNAHNTVYFESYLNDETSNDINKQSKDDSENNSINAKLITSLFIEDLNNSTASIGVLDSSIYTQESSSQDSSDALLIHLSDEHAAKTEGDENKSHIKRKRNDSVEESFAGFDSHELDELERSKQIKEEINNSDKFNEQTTQINIENNKKANKIELKNEINVNKTNDITNKSIGKTNSAVKTELIEEEEIESPIINTINDTEKSINAQSENEKKTNNEIVMDDNKTKVSKNKNSEESTTEHADSPSDKTQPTLEEMVSLFIDKVPDPIYLLPFECGWKREFVFRAIQNTGDKRKTDNLGEAYYITPNGKKIRTKLEVQQYLHSDDGLTTDNFTFFREPLNISTDKESVRMAKLHQTSVKRVQNFLDIGVPDPSFGFGKRIPKPKMPKGASPPPPPRQSKITNVQSRESISVIGAVDIENKLTPKSGKGTKHKLSSIDQQHAITPAATTAPLQTGEDISPPFKKRLLSRSGGSATLKTPAAITNNHQLNTVTPLSSMPISSTPITLIKKSNKRGRPGTINVEPTIHNIFAANFFNNVSIGYDILLNAFQYLTIQELLRASCVCRMWYQIANNNILWRTVRMKNSQVIDWSVLLNTLKRNGTRHLDLRKMIGGEDEIIWQDFSKNIKYVTDLETIDLCRCPAQVVEELFISNPSLKIINAVAIRDNELNINSLNNLKHLTELRLKCSNLLEIENLQPLQELTELKHLSLTSVKELGLKGYEAFGYLTNLESLELGECGEFSSKFASEVLIKLQKLEKLRLERGQDQCSTFDILDAIPQLKNLIQLELVNFDVKCGFDTRLQQCTNIKRLLLIPTYISQSATTNHMVLGGVLKLSKNLEVFTWVVTLELLRVTELYVDQCDEKKDDPNKQPCDSIPVLKPVPGFSEDNTRVCDRTIVSDVPQVEILTLDEVAQILLAENPKLNFQMIKLPFLSTWKQTLVEVPVVAT